MQSPARHQPKQNLKTVKPRCNLYQTTQNTSPILGMLIRTFDKMPKEKQGTHLSNANEFFEKMLKG